MVDQSPGSHAPPDFVPLDFFLCGFVEEYIYSTSVDIIATLHAMIIEAIQNVAKAKLTCTWAKLDYHLDVIRTTRGSHFEMDAHIKVLC
jgi:hypothetical protein